MDVVDTGSAPTAAPACSENSASPLSMQMPNQTIDEGLDFKHGDGASAGIRAATTLPLKRPLDSSDSDTVQMKHARVDAAGAELGHSFADDNAEDDDFKSDCHITGFGEEEVNGEDGFAVGCLGSATGSVEPVLSFDILDEVVAGQGDDDDEDCYDDNEYGDQDSESDISDDEIEAMLEAGLHTRKQDVEDEDIAHEVKEKVILKVRGHDHFDVLPEGWIQVTHNSGMPVYLHKQSRVCSLSKPYFLGPGSIRKHEVPISAIPCLHYRREKEKEEKCPVTNGVHEGAQASPDAVTDLAARVPAAKVESVKESQKERSLDFMAFREYCEGLFDFQTIQLRKFK